MDSDALGIISDGLSAVTEGCRLPVRRKDSEDWSKAEVICMRQNKGSLIREQRYMSRHVDVRQYRGFFDILMYIWCISTRLCFRFPDGVVLVTQIWVGKNSQCFHEVSLGPIVIRWFKTKGRVRLSYTYLVIVQLYQGSGDHLEPTWTPKLTMQG